MEKFSNISLDLTNETRNMLLDMLPNLHCFQNSAHCCGNSSIHLNSIQLLRASHLKNDETKEEAEQLASTYIDLINAGTTSYNITLTHIGWSDCAMAFKWHGGFHTFGKNKVLAISTYDYHNETWAKKIDKWIEIKPITIEVELKLHR